MPPKRTKFHSTITSPEHFEKVIEDKRLSLIDCHLEWCGPCTSIEPNYSAIFFTYEDSDNRMAFYQCSEENLPEALRNKLKLTLIPRFLIYQNGDLKQEIDVVIYNEFVDAFEKHLPELDE